MDIQKIISDLEDRRVILLSQKKQCQMVRTVYKFLSLIIILYMLYWAYLYVENIIRIYRDDTVRNLDYYSDEKFQRMYVLMLIVTILWLIFLLLDYKIVKSFSDELKTFSEIYKKTFVVSLMAECFDEFEFDIYKGFETEKINEFKIVKNGNVTLSEDYLSGAYRGIFFEQAEVSVKNRIKDGWKLYYMGILTFILSLKKNKISSKSINKRTKVGDKKDNMRTYFNGQMITFSFPKENIKPLYVFSDNYMYRPDVSDGTTKPVDMENVDFNRSFDVLASDEYDAFYVLTPHMQERIKKLMQKFESVAIRFDGDKLYLGLNNINDLFDADIERDITYTNERTKVYGDLQIIKDIIDTMLMQS